jgi:hypothetical protein
MAAVDGMISLPSSLSPWSRQLNGFPVDVALTIGPIVQRLASAIAPLHSEKASGVTDPDGFDGLVNRGSYERLIPSDWLLSDEIPEEFDRRAAMREHLFLKIAHRDPAHGQGSVVLFDAGPEQIGSPRLAHLAVLIVLLRRAERARASFSWGIVQDEEMIESQGVNHAEVGRLIKARSYRSSSEAQVQAWLHRALVSHMPEEIWLVGGPQVHRMSGPQMVSRVTIADVLDPAVRRLSVEIHRAKAKPQGILLDLPENYLCAKLLRDPYELATADPQRFSTPTPLSGLVFGNRRVVATTDGNVLVSFPMPNAPTEKPGNSKRYALGKMGSIVAAGPVGRSIAAISAEEISLRLTYIGKPYHPPNGRYFLQDSPRAPRFNPLSSEKENVNGLLHRCAHIEMGDKSSILVLDAARGLFRLSQVSGDCVVALEETGVLALTSFNGVPTYVAANEVDSTIDLVVRGKQRVKTVLQPASVTNPRAFFGYGANMELGLVAIQSGETAWSAFAQVRKLSSAPVVDKVSDIDTESSQEVVGIIREAFYQEALITLREDRHVITLKGPKWERRILESQDRIAHVTTSLTKPLIACSTLKGDLTVYSLGNQRILCRFLWGKADA